MVKRIIANLILFISFFWAPWFVTISLAIILAIIFTRYWEAALVGLMIDSLYSLPEQKNIAGLGVFLALALIVISLSSLIKNKIRFF